MICVSILVASPLVSSARASSQGCDPIYQRNIRDLQRAMSQTTEFMKYSLLFDIPKDAAKAAGVKVLQRIGLWGRSAAVDSMMLPAAIADVLTDLEISAFFYAINKPNLTAYSNGYKIIQEARKGGGPDLDALYRKLGKDNPEWRDQSGMTEEVFRELIVRMDDDEEFCSEVAGYTLDELTNRLFSMSDAEVNSARARILHPHSPGK